MFPPILILPQVVAIADRAGAAILRHYEQGTAATAKADGSPVTAADQDAEALIVAALRELTPSIPVVAEEAVAAGDVPEVGNGSFWLVDPLDGTREFIARNGEFTVNIALIEARRPILGVVLAPAIRTAWWGAIGHGATLRDPDGTRAIQARPVPAAPVAVASRSHRDARTDAWLAEQNVADIVSAGSSLKFCRVAEAKADLYPRFGRTMEWDTAAGQAVLEAAGGRVLRLDGSPLAYAKPGFENPEFIARGA
ncbi:MAG TPA: 3'(2'),5'-bisphosphate nucleotidase CysQ [Geminicoccus sp.]|uniref:3'(2'),5'-bisphosphate nucleotidase CysQ n=1 Tax=Geminicoccus sp. TaxID=2024832 RepID=UPI002C2A1C3E|nr:3'(2'),5'-bisphosphate nucleotidase CysQ [Geminicoccus sp.]HWL67222.1 3'(2'),5'-bisphosphate nucleotidase CysQ [Geminicoccus sp.]